MKTVERIRSVLKAGSDRAQWAARLLSKDPTRRLSSTKLLSASSDFPDKCQKDEDDGWGSVKSCRALRAPPGINLTANEVTLAQNRSMLRSDEQIGKRCSGR
ncbi:hypothetical protein Slin15195_G121010 [Septoria linicola]|uniref:Uncharacterized protein n=1 Tax=Septoria linicola TaxID=215465 RepID=A0A9Q9B7L8_9PEZI|nr:hypothetical protein Slin14017_G097990 [Septoria linicola]USW58782.1 hypothetical protein Slin15195_G121010 [Septoria linicola]